MPPEDRLGRDEGVGLAEEGAAGALGHKLHLFHLAIITYWLQDPSRNKEQTLALLDRCLKLAERVLRKGGWDW